MKTQKRRRNEAKTDYLKRLNLLKSGKPRLTFRKTNKYIITQFISSEEAKDKVEIGITSKDLLKYGWPKNAEGSLKSMPASYLTGYLIAKRIKKEKKGTPIIDIGMILAKHKSKVFAFIKGVIDAGLNIECNQEFFPEKERIEGAALKNKINFKEIKSKIEKL